MVVITFIICWIRVKHDNGFPYRWVYSCATVLLGTHAAILLLSVAASSYPGVPSAQAPTNLIDLSIIVLAGTIRWSFNAGLIMAAIALADPMLRTKDLFENFSDQTLEAGALGLGLVSAILLIVNPIALPGVVIAIAALARSALVNQYQHATHIDTKTGLATAEHWHDCAESMLKRARLRGDNFGILLVDLDNFKAMNRIHGSAHGDRVLRAVADDLLRGVRETDTCGRWGGDKFSVMVAEVTAMHDVRRVADRIRRCIQSVVVEPLQGSAITAPLDISAPVGGVLHVPGNESTLDELILAAESALYEAKNDGRNTVRLTSARTDLPTDSA
ncbi:GGDEF domain-containing protein [Phytoactinopolyspora mesophila]|uniref:Diguanylate cyclase n=1 Tax=Phytoactinopolyspora mesophila TaxID=2650750 RepID=A0A7K3M5C1_9ACTN|nr:GGDEF domain-containing protein [Phytoactinopolyspora mesophila]NDL57638.1 diguanylate cyclase [Phytoactinopolyspora mesophila]